MSVIETADHAPPPASLRIKFFYGLGSIAPGALNALGGLAMFFYNQIIGVPAPIVGLALSATVLSDAVSDVFIGYASDKTRSRWGRRHPFMAAAFLLLPIAIYFRWRPPTDWASDAMFWYIYGTGLFLNFAFSIFEIPSNALGPELTKSYHDRTSLLSYRWLLGALASAVVTILIYGVFLRATPQHALGQLNPAGYAPLSLAVTLMIGGSILAMFWGTFHLIPTLYRPVVVTKPQLWPALKQAARMLRNHNFLVAVVAGVIAGLGSGLDAGLRIYFYTFLWGFRSADILVLTLLAIPIPFVAAMVAPWLAKRFSKRSACMGMFFASVVVGHAPMFMKLTGILTLPPSPALLGILAAFTFVAGVLGIGGYIIVSSMIADIVEDVQATTGERAEGLLITADTFPNRIANSLSVAFPGLMLAWVQFPASATPGLSTLYKMQQLGWVYVPVMATISCLSIATWGFYRIDKTTHEANLRAIG